MSDPVPVAVPILPPPELMETVPRPLDAVTDDQIDRATVGFLEELLIETDEALAVANGQLEALRAFVEKTKGGA